MYCGDNGIRLGLTMSVISVAKNTPGPISFFIVTAGLSHKGKTYTPISPEYAKRLDDCVKKHSKENSVTLVDASKHFESIKLSKNAGTRFTPLCMLRLFADEISAIPEKILYLDCDVICRKNLQPLYQTNVENCEFAGILDRYGKHFFRKKLLRYDYVNSGVLLLNMKKIRETGLFKRCRKVCTERKMLMPDQSALNKLAKGKKLLPKKYTGQQPEKNDTVLRHFTTFFKFFPTFRTVTVKPWQQDMMHRVLKNYEYDSLYLEAKEITNGIKGENL